MKNKSDRALHMRETYKRKIQEESWRELANFIEWEGGGVMHVNDINRVRPHEIQAYMLRMIEDFMKTKGILPKGKGEE